MAIHRELDRKKRRARRRKGRRMSARSQTNSRRFFSAQTCDRCGIDLGFKIKSWFIEKETICGPCQRYEHQLKQALRDSGVKLPTIANCGYLPDMP